METVVAMVVAAFLGLAGVALALAIKRTRAFRAAVRHTAESLGLAFEPGGLIRSPRAHGVVAGLRVEVRHVRERDRRRSGQHDPVLFTRVRVAGAWGKDLVARARGVPQRQRRGFFASLGDTLSAPSGLTTGDPRLDGAVELRGPNRYDALSRLGEATRDQLRELVGAGHGEVVDGAFTLQQRRLVTDASALANLTRAAVDLGRGLCRDGRPAEDALADIVVADPVPAVRVAALERLVVERPRHPETARAVAAALAPGDPELRVLAASHAGEEGFDAAREVAALDPLFLLEAGAPVAARRRALELLGTRYPARRAEATLAIDAALATAPDPVLEAGLGAAAALGHRPDLGHLAAVAPRVGPASAPAYAGALAAHGPAGEPLLLQLLTIDDAGVRVVAAQALGQIAGLAAVEPLLPHTTGVFKSRTLKLAARNAVAAIQARASGGTAGSLSIVEAAAGELSLCDDD